MSDGQRGIALVGFGHTNALAPWSEKTWAIWTMNNAPAVFAGRYDVLFEMHTAAVRAKERTYRLTAWDDAKIAAAAETHTVWTLNGTPAGTKVFPLDVLRAYFKREPYFTSSVAFMVALAIYTAETQPDEYAKRIGIWGIELQAASEYAKERGCLEWWCGVAFGRGFEIYTPLESPILSSPYLYGYQDELIDALKVKVAGRQREIERYIEQARIDVSEKDTALREAQRKVAELGGMLRETDWVLESETDAVPHGKGYS